jgi:hypothetical protein
MKKLLLLLSLIVFPVLPHKHELKLYKKGNTLIVLAAAIGEIVSLGGLGITTLVVKLDPEKRISGEAFTYGIWSTAGFIGSSAVLLNAALRKDQNKPILIFDEEGFTYNKPMGLFKERKYVRYLWKDVISHWSSQLNYGNWLYSYPLKHEWHYHIAGKKDIVTINVRELDIPQKMLAKVESLRQGNVSALWRS